MNMINKDEEVANRFSDPSKKLVEYVTDFSDMRDEDIELTKPIYENYGNMMRIYKPLIRLALYVLMKK